MSWFEKQFRLSENKVTVRSEISAGITTFMAMAYIIVVNPGILSESGMPFGSVLVATCLGAALGCFLMAFLANYPFALAPGMGLNAFFTYSVCLTMGISWHVALTAVFVEGLIFIFLTVTSIREKVVNSIPTALKVGIAAGIGLFIAFIGLRGAGIIVDNPATLVGLGKLTNWTAFLTIVGVLLMAYLQYKGIRGGILISMVVITIVGIPLGVTKIPESLVSLPPSLSPIFWKMDFSMLSNLNFWVIVFAFFFVDFFDTIGTLVGCSARAGLLDKNGFLPRARPALLSDAIATSAGAVLGTSTVTTFVESAAGIEQGGRTGLTAFTVGVLFLLAVFFSPIFMIVPSCATSAALIMVGAFMISGIANLDCSDWTELFPVMLALIMMPFAYLIAVGIEFGIVSYAALKLVTGQYKKLNWLMYVLAVLFIANRFFN